MHHGNQTPRSRNRTSTLQLTVGAPVKHITRNTGEWGGWSRGGGAVGGGGEEGGAGKTRRPAQIDCVRPGGFVVVVVVLFYFLLYWR